MRCTAAIAVVALGACGPERAPPGPPPDPSVDSDTAVAPRGPVVTVEVAAPGLFPTVSAVPPGGTFVGTTAVELTTDDPEAEILFTTDPAVDLRPYVGPIDLHATTTLRAVAVNHLGSSDPIAPTFVRLEPALDGASADLAQIVLWSEQAAPQTKSEAYTPFTLTVFEPAPGGRVTFPGPATLSVRAGLKVRGSSSAGYPKRPYRIETWSAELDADADVALLGMPPEADWVLTAPLNFDRGLVRNALIYALSNDIGAYAPRTRFAEVYVAEGGEDLGPDDYVGVYVVTERIERDAERVQITALLPGDDALPELSGGYLFKEDRTGPGEVGFVAGTAGGVLEFEQPFVYVDPDEAVISGTQAAYLTAVLDELGAAVTAPDFRHPTSGRHYRDIIDVDAWIDHHILNTFAKNPDAFRLSGYFHKDRDGLLAAGPIWDFDRTMGCAADSRADDPTWWDPSNQTTDTTEVFEHGFYGGLFDDPAFAVAYFTRLAALLQTDLSVPAVHARVDAMALELGEAAPRNFATWSGFPPRGGSFEAEITHLKDWLDARHAWMSGCLALPDPRACTGD